MLCVVCVEWANLGRFRRVSSTRAGWSCAARARLESGGGRKRAGARLAAQTHSAGACAVAELARARVGALRARVMLLRGAGAVIISGGETKKMSFPPKKNTKNAPRRIRTRARAFIYRRARVFCLPRAGVGAYIAGIMATRAKKTAPKTAATSATATELVPVAKRKRGGQIGNRNGVGHGRPRGRSENAYVVKLNIAISRAQREKLETAAENAGVKYTDFLRNFIDSL